jgi:hypothetical protein
MHDLRLNTDFSSVKDTNSNLQTVCELSTDPEGVNKLDAVITESKLSKNIHMNHENINKNMKLIEKFSHELAITQCEQQDHFRKISKQDLAINQLIHHSEAIQSEQGKNNQQISEQYFLLKSMDNKKLTALVLLDLSKAFDSVDHSILLKKLSNIGVSDEALNWFKSYITDRKQFVRIGSSVSEVLPITHGVPQGAILSPLLFCIYINDLSRVPQASELESFVDDSKIFMSFPIEDIASAKTKIEEDLKLVATWFFENKLFLNPEKTKLLLIGTRQLLGKLLEETTITFLGEEITPTTNAKDLGLTLDSYLTYDYHIKNVVSSCMAKLCQINRVQDSFDRDSLRLIINALVMSKLYYCSTVLSNTSATNIEKLRAVQNFACRILTNTGRYDHVTPALRAIRWLPVEEHIERH